MRVILTIILSFLVLSSFSQTIKEREKDLDAYMPGTTWKTKTNKAWELLSIDKFNETAISYILRVYIADYKRDSISIFFENLIDKNKNSVIPYLLRIQFSRLERLNDKQRIEYLTRAYQIDSSCIKVDSLLGRLCYNQFNEQFLLNRVKNEKTTYYAKASLNYLGRLYFLEKRNRRILKYPLIQLSSYLGDSINNKKYKKYNQDSFHFPLWAFKTLPDDWETNYGINLIDKLIRSELEGFSTDLTTMNEPILVNSTSSIFRYTEFPSTGNFYVISLKNENNKVTIYWKVFENKEYNKPGKKIIDKNKQLQLSDWIKFTDFINEKNFWNMPSRSVSGDVCFIDGSTSIFEGNEHGKYYVLASWGGSGINELCLALKKLTDLDSNEEK